MSRDTHHPEADVHLPPIIAFIGRAGSGKSAAANCVLRTHVTAAHLTFAGPIKAMTRVLIQLASPKKHHIEPGAYVSNPALKEEPIPFLGNLTARRIMQTLGSEWGRNTVHQDIWVAIAAAKLERLIGSTFKSSDKVPIKVVIDDARFPNEIEMIRAYGGVIVEIVRPGNEKPAEIAQHASETQILTPDVTVVNDGNLEDLEAKIAALFPVPPKEGDSKN